jgi:hypothetical protein
MLHPAGIDTEERSVGEDGAEAVEVSGVAE